MGETINDIIFDESSPLLVSASNCANIFRNNNAYLVLFPMTPWWSSTMSTKNEVFVGQPPRTWETRWEWESEMKRTGAQLSVILLTIPYCTNDYGMVLPSTQTHFWHLRIPCCYLPARETQKWPFTRMPSESETVPLPPIATLVRQLHDNIGPKVAQSCWQRKTNMKQQ